MSIFLTFLIFFYQIVAHNMLERSYGIQPTLFSWFHFVIRQQISFPNFHKIINLLTDCWYELQVQHYNVQVFSLYKLYDSKQCAFLHFCSIRKEFGPRLRAPTHLGTPSLPAPSPHGSTFTCVSTKFYTPSIVIKSKLGEQSVVKMYANVMSMFISFLKHEHGAFM